MNSGTRIVGDALTNCLKQKCSVSRNACNFQHISDFQSCWTGFLQQWGAECSPLSRGTFKFRPKMSGKMSMASRLGCPAERRLLSFLSLVQPSIEEWWLCIPIGYRPIGMCPNTIQIPTISYHDHSEDEVTTLLLADKSPSGQRRSHDWRHSS